MFLSFIEISTGDFRPGGVPYSHEEMGAAIVKSFIKLQRPFHHPFSPREFRYGLHRIQVEANPICPASRCPKEVRHLFLPETLQPHLKIIERPLEGISEPPHFERSQSISSSLLIEQTCIFFVLVFHKKGSKRRITLCCSDEQLLILWNCLDHPIDQHQISGHSFPKDSQI